MFYTGTEYESETYAAMANALLALRDKWSIGVIDLRNDAEMNAVCGSLPFSGGKAGEGRSNSFCPLCAKIRNPGLRP